MKMKLMLASLLVAITLTGCASGTKEKDEVKSMENLVVTDGFSWRTEKTVTLKLIDTKNRGARVNVLLDIPENGGEPLVANLAFDMNGEINETVVVPTTQKTLYIQSCFITMESVEVSITADNKAGYEYDAPQTISAAPVKRLDTSYIYTTAGFDFLSKYNQYGVPATLICNKNTVDPIDKGLIARLNKAFVEKVTPKTIGKADVFVPVPTDAIEKTYDVNLTVVHDGGAYQSSLAYYTYKDTAPKNISEITNLKMVFANFETGNMGGDAENYLHEGDKINIGKVTSGTHIGFVLIENSWRRNWNGKTWTYLNDKVIGTNNVRYYSTTALNADKTQHTVSYYDAESGKTIIGMEDINGGGDKDYNDIMVYLDVKSDSPQLPDEKTITIPTTYKTPEKTVVYEDLWPSKGDYDFNDQVVKYNYELLSTYSQTTITNPDGTIISSKSSNVLNKLTLNYTLKAAGAGVQSGFGIVLPIDSSLIEKVEGQNITTQWPLSIDTNGVEKTGKTSESVIIVYDNAKRVLGKDDRIEFMNTVKGQTVFAPVTGKITVTFKAGTAYTAMAKTYPFNPFIYRSYERGLEVHLPGQAPTALANVSKYFSTKDDASVVGTKYYKTTTNLPWALDILGDFKYPVEFCSITKAYPEFYNWANTAGAQNPNWFNNPDSTNLY